MPKSRNILLFLAFVLVAAFAAGMFFVLNNESTQTASDSGKSRAPATTQPARIVKDKPQQLTPAQKLAATRVLIQEQLAAAPEFSPFFDRLKTSFPTAYKRIIDSFADTVSKGGRIESADLYLAQALSGLRASHGVLAAHASTQALEKVFALRAATLRALAGQDPKLCADFLYGATSRNFFRFSAANRKLVASMMEADLAAIIDGRTSKQERPAPTAEEFQQLEAALRQRKLEKPEIEMLLDMRNPDPPLADTTVCKAGQIYYDVLNSLPEELKAKIYALSLRLLART
ncbi:MAG: hypothetical protein KDJ29_01530 [Hyphomicrobiales bacterium]|nr:hypothetical protein [Hyphomicrobiales bacterium]